MKRIAIVGAGVAGLGVARMLAGGNRVVLYELEPRLGGHARTIDVEGASGSIAVDTGFIVYNEVNYPRLTALFAELGVATQSTDMSFGISVGGIELNGSSLAGLFAQPRNIVSPSYWGMLRDVGRFFRRATDVLDVAEDPSLGEWLSQLRIGTNARDRFIVPMGAAIWSTPPGELADMPAKTFVRFFRNHNLLSAIGHHQWRTVSGGSRRYVEALAAALRVRFGVTIRTAAQVRAVCAVGHGRHEIITADGQREAFDDVVLACHADTALSLIEAPTSAERGVLSSFAFRDNNAVLHGDSSFMPKARAAWASWVFSADDPDQQQGVTVTYWMNRLQNLSGPPLFVTLNPSRPVADHSIMDQHTFRHPMLTRAAVAAQAHLPEIQGRRGLWFAGAWTRFGFHEDGLESAAWIADRMAEGRAPDASKQNIGLPTATEASQPCA